MITDRFLAPHGVLVVQDGEVVGIITPSDLARWLRRWRALEGSAR